MKILALTILFILMFFRIKGTPSALSKTLWRKKMIKQLAKNKENNNGKPSSEPLSDPILTEILIELIIFFIELLLIVFYIVLGSKIGTTEFIVISALQVFTCLWSLNTNLLEVKKTAFSYNIEDFRFHRFQLLFNVVLDYIYYPWAIYMLLK